MAVMIKSSTPKYIVVALLVMCTLHALHASAAASGGAEMMKSGTGHRRDLKQGFIECTSHQKDTAANECNIDISGATNYFYCLTGVNAGGCRSQALGVFGDDCSSSCVIL